MRAQLAEWGRHFARAAQSDRLSMRGSHLGATGKIVSRFEARLLECFWQLYWTGCLRQLVLCRVGGRVCEFCWIIFSDCPENEAQSLCRSGAAAAGQPQCCSSRKSESQKFFHKCAGLSPQSEIFIKCKVKVNNVASKISPSQFGNFQKCSQYEEEKMFRKSLDPQRPLAGWREPWFYHLYRPLAAKMATWEKIFDEICETLVKSWVNKCDSLGSGGQWRLRKDFQMGRRQKRPKLAGTQMVSRRLFFNQQRIPRDFLGL